MRLLRTVILVAAVFLSAAPVCATPIAHTPNQRVPPVTVTVPGSPVPLSGELGANYIDFGVDYSFGRKDGLFRVGIGNADLRFTGVDDSGRLNLLFPVDGQIVVPGTTGQGLTDLVSITAGDAAAGTLLLEVFDVNGILVASAFNPGSGITTTTIDRGGVFDIASFRFSTPGADTYGITRVQLNEPVAAVPVPEPTSLAVWSLLIVAGGITCSARRRVLRA